MQLIKKLFQRFHELPDNLPPNYYRAWVLSNYSQFMGGIVHFLFIFLFALVGIVPLALFNIVSTIFWALAVFANLKGYPRTSLLLANIEIVLHAFLCTAVIGWDTGFHYFILVMPSIIFFMPYKATGKIAASAINIILYILLNVFFHSFTPLVPIHSTLVAVFNLTNIAVFGFILAFFAFHYREVVLATEAKLESEYQKTNTALLERNQVLTQLNEELTEAADYVKSLLPRPLNEGTVKTDWRFVPSAALGGDAFGYQWIDEDHFAMYLLDVSGHGVGAALLSVSVMNALRSQTLPDTDFKDCKQVLESLNMAFPGEDNNDMFFSIWYGVYKKSTRELMYASGGHPPALLFGGGAKKGAEASLLRTPCYVIGGMQEVTYEKRECVVGEHDKLYIFSDGVYEVEKPDGSMWRLHEFTDFMIHNRAEGESALDHLYRYANTLKQREDFEDDFTIVEVSFN